MAKGQGDVFQHAHSINDLPIGPGPGKLRTTDDLIAATDVSYNRTRSGLKNPTGPGNADTVQKAIDALATGQIVRHLIFAPRLPAVPDVGNVYGDFANLYAALVLARNAGGRIVIEFHKGIGVTTTIPAGSYDFSECEWTGGPTVGTTPIEVADGAGITPGGNARGPWKISGALQVTFLAASVPFWGMGPGSGFNWLFLDERSVIAQNGPVIPFQVGDASGSLRIVVMGGSRIAAPAGGASAIFGLGSPLATSTIDLYDGAIVDNGTLDVGATMVWNINRYGVTPVFDPTSQSGGGTYIVNVEYAPAVLGDWNGVAPTSVANALDRIAAVLSPIP